MNKIENIQLIAGPCSAETEKQVMNIAQDLANNKKVSLFRAGIWKPRTRPGSFEGVGTIGLKWLNQVTNEYGLKCTTEVANAKHVDESLKYGLETLWIGARTTANPFSMEEISNALKSTETHIMIKNPVNPDLDLWIGAVERILNAGITNISLIHRGFSTQHKDIYRNKPLWNIPMEMKKRFPTLPLICDPSHIGGDKKLLSQIASQAVNLDYNGLMIEVHNNPEEAWSDKQQQITPYELNSLLCSLNKNYEVANNHQISLLRLLIDGIDGQFIDLLNDRMQIVEKIGILKAEEKLNVYQESRWNSMLSNLIVQGNKNGLDKDFIQNIFNTIHNESIKKQNEIKITH